MGAPIGAASGLKLAYAGLTKGFTALAATIITAASRAGGERASRFLGELTPLTSWGLSAAIIQMPCFAPEIT
jgi:hypothetical protein